MKKIIYIITTCTMFFIIFNINANAEVKNIETFVSKIKINKFNKWTCLMEAERGCLDYFGISPLKSDQCNYTDFCQKLAESLCFGEEFPLPSSIPFSCSQN